MRYASGKASDSPRNYLVFKCIDTGPGIAVENIQNLFDSDGGRKMSQELENADINLVPATLPDEGQEKKYGTPKKNSDAESIQKGSVQKDIGKLEPMNTKNNHKMASEDDLKKMENSVVKVSLSKSDPKHLKSSIVATTPNSFVVETTIVEDEADVNAASKRKFATVDVLHEGSSCNSENPVKRPRRRKKFALIIDDSKTIRKALERTMTNFGFEVILAENGRLGLEEMKSTVFDIVLCDFLMPIMDGMDCVKQYREWESNHRSWFEQ
eukprot:scaffold5651_cov133-Chaetoceros_neogracile.AAC.1